MQITVTKEYFCGYYCQKCGAFNVEEGEVYSESETRQKAEERLEERYWKIKDDVINRKAYKMRGIKGVCKECGTKQAWCMFDTISLKMGRAILGVMIALAVTSAGFALAMRSIFPLWAGGMIFIALILLLGLSDEKISEMLWEPVCRQVDEQLASITQWNPYPYIMSQADYVNVRDERSVKLKQMIEMRKKEKWQQQWDEYQKRMAKPKVPRQPQIPARYPFTQWHTYGSPYYGIAEHDPVVEFVDPKTGNRTTIIDEDRKIVNFPGIEGRDEIQKMMGEGNLIPYNSFGVQFCKEENGRYRMIWEVQPDGRFWEDEDGFGGTSDDEIQLCALIDQEGRFITPFYLYCINGVIRVKHDESAETI